MRYFLFFLSFFLCLNTVSAQEIQFSRPQKLHSKVRGFSIVGLTSEGVIIHKYGEKYHIIEAFDKNNMSLRWSREYQFENKKAKVLKMIPQTNGIIIVYYIKEKGVTSIFTKKVNMKLNPVGEPILVHQEERSFGERGFDLEVEVSETNNVFVVQLLNRGTSEYDSVLNILMNNQLQILKKHTVDISEKDWVYHNTLVATNGNVYVNTRHLRRTLLSNRSQYDFLRITEIKPTTSEPRTIKIGELQNMLTDSTIEEDYVNKKLVLTGFYSLKNGQATNGYFYTTINLSDFTLNETHFELLENDLIRKTFEQTILSNIDGIKDLNVEELMVRSDGGALLVGEASYQSTRTVYTNGVGVNDFGARDRQVSSFYHNDIVALSINPDGTLDWGEVMKKSQYSESDNGYYASFGTMNHKKSLHFIFNDEASFKSNLTQYVLKPDGDYKISTIFNSEEYNLLTAARYAQQITSNEIILPTFNYRNEFMLTKITY